MRPATPRPSPRSSFLSRFAAGAAVLVAVLLAGSGSAQPVQPAPAIPWEGKDQRGAAVKVPAANRPSVVVFVRADQPQSVETLKTVKVATASLNAQVVVILSGQHAADQGKLLGDGVTGDWPVVYDLDYAASGAMGVHVWPTTIVVSRDGAQVAHLPGMSTAFAKELSSYLDFAADRIDRHALTTRLATTEVVTDSAAQAAARHVQVAQKLLERGSLDQAKSELDRALAQKPDDAGAALMLAKVLTLSGQPKEALARLDQVKDGVLPPWQVAVVRGRALIGLENYAAAKAALAVAAALNPDPSEAHYLLGLAFQHEGDAPRAAGEFRAAAEAARPGMKVVAKPGS